MTDDATDPSTRPMPFTLRFPTTIACAPTSAASWQSDVAGSPRWTLRTTRSAGSGTTTPASSASASLIQSVWNTSAPTAMSIDLVGSTDVTTCKLASNASEISAARRAAARLVSLPSTPTMMIRVMVQSLSGAAEPGRPRVPVRSWAIRPDPSVIWITVEFR